ncbi:MAG: HNH endonuclease, partial [Alphaproteobacteria bacterium]|nr:HNH endonuclease [Alphaproteobacteria bacterium]
THQGHNKNKSWTINNLDKILIESSNYTNTHYLKNRLWKVGILERKCYECNIKEWRGKPAPLQLDHINGKRTDNRIENLRILCANCHAQTETWTGKNRPKYPNR